MAKCGESGMGRCVIFLRPLGFSLVLALVAELCDALSCLMRHHGLRSHTHWESVGRTCDSNPTSQRLTGMRQRYVRTRATRHSRLNPYAMRLFGLTYRLLDTSAPKFGTPRVRCRIARSEAAMRRRIRSALEVQVISCLRLEFTRTDLALHRHCVDLGVDL